MKAFELLSPFALILLTWSSAAAGLSLTINTHTANEFSFTIGGSFDADVIGSQKHWLALKPNYSTNVGTNVPWMDDAIGTDQLFNVFTVVTNTVQFDGMPADTSVANAVNSFGDSIYFANAASAAILAGTTVTGTVTLQRAGAFDTSFTNFELASGFSNGPDRWVRLEAVGVPEPSSFLFLGLIGVAVVGWKWKKRNA